LPLPPRAVPHAGDLEGLDDELAEFRTHDVFRSEFTSNLLQLGLPIIAIDDLSELSMGLLEQHRQIYANYRKEKVEMLWLKYWKSKILVRTRNEN